MNIRLSIRSVIMVLVTVAGTSCLQAQDRPQPQIYWLRSPQKAQLLAKQFHLPILVYVTSESCVYCRKLEHEVWKNSDIIEMVEAGFIPLELTAEQDEKTVAALGVQGFPTTLLFTSDAKYITGAAGYLPTNRMAGLLRSVKQPQPSSQVTQDQ